jgi:hypothetical protein
MNAINRRIAQVSSQIVDVGSRTGGKVGIMFTSAAFGPDILIVLTVLILLLALFGLSIWAIIDASLHSKRDFFEAGSSKVAWIIVIAIFTVFFGFGTLIAIYYLIRVRPKVLMIEAGLSNSFI